MKARLALCAVVLISTIACTNIYIEPGSDWCSTCQKFEDQGYQKVYIITNYDKLSFEDFKAYVEKQAERYDKVTKIRYVWMKYGWGERVVREGIIYYE